MDKIEVKGRRRARKLALQALYQWLMSGMPLTDIEAQSLSIASIDKVDVEYFSRLLHGVAEHLTTLEDTFESLLDRPLASLNPIEHTILRMSTFELIYAPEMPYRVVLDESILLARAFGSQEGHRYVNGVLNNVAQKVRAVEIALDVGK